MSGSTCLAHRRVTQPVIAVVLFLAAACSDAAAPVIEQISEPQLSTRPNLDFAILGRGFGLSGVSYSLDDGRGLAGAGAWSVRLTGPDSFETVVPPANVIVSSPHRIEVRVRLVTAPPVGRYSLGLLRDTVVVAEASQALELTAPEDEVQPDMGTLRDGG